jgi:uncharacterized protein DUF3723
MSQTRPRVPSVASEGVEEVMVVEDAKESSAVTQELNRNYVGILSLYRDQVDVEWSSGTGEIRNRSLNPRGVQKLVERFGQNLDRANPKHHMAATIDKESAMKLLSGLRSKFEGWNDVPGDFDSLKRRLRFLNDLADYPIVEGELWDEVDCDPFNLQAGQHRYKALEGVMESGRWWPVKIYLSPMSEAALTRLRENVAEVQLAQSDGERFVQIMQYRQLESRCRDGMANLEKGSDEYEMLAIKAEQAREAANMKIKEFGSGSSHRALATLKRPKFAEALYAGLSMPALADEFSFAAVGDILTLRCQEVYSS